MKTKSNISKTISRSFNASFEPRDFPISNGIGHEANPGGGLGHEANPGGGLGHEAGTHHVEQKESRMVKLAASDDLTLSEVINL